MARHKKRGEPKLPVAQLTILGILRFAEPVALTSVFPYLPEMIESFNVPKSKIATWAGITSAVFSLSQCLTGIAWGQASDRFGRKPVLLVGLLCTMTASLGFGFSGSLAWAIAARSFAGASSGTVGIIRTTVAEMVPQKVLQPKAFSLMPLVWTVGSIFGPMIGGALAKPASKYPAIFGNSTFFNRFPFALPGIVISIFFITGITVGVLFLKETLETKKHRRDYGRVLGKTLCGAFSRKKASKSKHSDADGESSPLLKDRRSSDASTNGIQGTSLAPPSYREVFSPQSNINLLAYSLLALHSIAYDQLLAVFLHLPPQDRSSSNDSVRLPFKFAGGFGLDSGRIGLLFTMYGVVGMFIQFLVFPPVARYYGVLNCLKACTIGFPLAYLLTPFAVLMPTSNSQQIAIFAVMLLKLVSGIFAFPCSTILLTNSARSLRLLGTLNGVATSLSAIGRATGPSIGGATFSLGIDIGYVILPWWTLGICAALGHLSTWWIIEMDGFGGEESDFSDDEENEDGAATPRHDKVLHSKVAVDGENDPSERNAPDDFAVDNDSFLPTLDQTPIVNRRRIESNQGHTYGSMSIPIGMGQGIGPGGGRRLSNGLGQTLTGLGTSGASYQG